MSEESEESVIAAAIAGAKAKLAQAASARAEEEKWAAKRTVSVKAIKGPRDPRDPNAAKHKSYWVPGHQLLIDGPALEAEFSERQIHEMKADPFVYVDDPQDADQQADKKKSEADSHAKKVEEAKAFLAAEAPSTGKATGVAPAAVDALSELKSFKKDRR